MMWKPLILAMVLAAIAPTASAQQIKITGPETRQLTEGKSYNIAWKSSGVKSVSVIAEGDNISRPDRTPGHFKSVIVKTAPDSRENVQWKVPSLDARTVTIRVKGYASDGKPVGVSSKEYNLRPALLADRNEDGIYVDLRSPKFQRLYVMTDGLITHEYLASGGRSRHFFPPNIHPKRPHDHAGVFSVLGKERSHWSKLYQVTMVDSLRYLNGHYIHGTTPSEYRKLGRAASAGCVRLHRTDARQLYSISPLGTRVEIFGP